MPITKQMLSIINIFLAILVGLFGLVVALMTLRRGGWIDEFITIAWTTPGTSPREFLNLMIAREVHPILHWGLVYLLQAEGVTDIALLRSLNLFGLLLVIFAIAYAFRLKSINLTQALIIWILFASSPIFFEYFAELRCYFLLYAASIATSVLWYVQMRQVEAGTTLPVTMILIWAACLAIFVNLHYFATFFGGMLTAALLAQLAIHRLWRQALVIGGVSLAAAAPALLIGALQVFAMPNGSTSWITTSQTESIKMAVQMVVKGAAGNIVVVSIAVVTCLYILEDRRRWIELRTPVLLLGVVALFLGALILINAVRPLMVDRYLIACAGAVTLSVAILAVSSSTPLWLPAVASAVALLLQAHTLRSNQDIDQRGWLPAARVVAELKSECPTSKIFAYPIYSSIAGPNEVAIWQKVNAVGYGYYAERFRFSYDDLQPGATVVASSLCPSIIWVAYLPGAFFNSNPQADAGQVLSKIQISTIGVAKMRRYGSGVVIIVQQ